MPESVHKPHDIIKAAAAGLVNSAALRSTPGGTKPEVRIFHPEPPAPAAAPMVRFHRAIGAHRTNGMGVNETQNFFDWQFRFFFLGLVNYLPTGTFLDWMKESATAIIQNPLSAPYQALVDDQIYRIIAPYRGQPTASLPVSKKTTPNIHPGRGAIKETMGDLSSAKMIIARHPELLAATAIFQGMHLHFLDEMIQEVERMPNISDPARNTFGEAILRLSINVSNANFGRLGIWTAIAHNRHIQSRKPSIESLSPDDFVRGWNLVEDGGGFSTEITTSQGAMLVSCPYHKPGRRLAATEICSHGSPDQNMPLQTTPNHGTRNSGYGLWCIYNALNHTSTSINAPHEATLQTIVDSMNAPETIALARDLTSTSFRQRITDARLRIHARVNG